MARVLWEQWDDAVAEGLLFAAQDIARQLLVEVAMGNEPTWTPGQRIGFVGWCADQSLVDVRDDGGISDVKPDNVPISEDTIERLETLRAIIPDTTPRDDPAAEGAAAARFDDVDRLIDVWDDAGGDWGDGWEERDPMRLASTKAAAVDLIEALGTNWDDWCHCRFDGYGWRDTFLEWCRDHGVIVGAPEFVVRTTATTPARPDDIAHTMDKRPVILARMSIALCKAARSAINAGEIERALGYLANHQCFMADALADCDTMEAMGAAVSGHQLGLALIDRRAARDQESGGQDR